jgi:hypothetical protein
MKFIWRHAEFFEFYIYLIVIFVCMVFVFGDLNTNVDFSDFMLVKIYSKFDFRKQKLSLNHKKIKAIWRKIMLK